MLSNSLIDIKMGYMDSISNIVALKSVLLQYKNVITRGDNSKIQYTQDYIKVDMKQIYRMIDELEHVIEGEKRIKRVIENGEEFESWLSSYKKLIANGLFKPVTAVDGTTIDDILNLEKKNKQTMFVDNSKVLSDLNRNLASGFVKTNAIVNKLEVTSGLISGELKGLLNILEAFNLDKQDYLNFLVANYSSVGQENVDELVDSLISAVNSGDKETIINYLTSSMNAMVNNNISKEEALDIFGLYQKILANKMIEDYLADGQLDGDYLEYFQLITSLIHITLIYPKTSSAGHRDVVEEIVGVSYKDGVITLETKMSVTSALGTVTVDETIQYDITDIDFSDLEMDSQENWYQYRDDYYKIWITALSVALSYVPIYGIVSVGDVQNVIACLEAWSTSIGASKEYIKNQLVDIFGGHMINGEKFPDVTTILCIVIADNLGVINLENIAALTSMSEDDAIEYLQENLNPEGDDPFDPWLEEMVPNANGYEEIPRGNALSNIQNYINDRLIINSKGE